MDNWGSPLGTREGHGSQQGSQQGDRRFAALLAKGGVEAASTRQAVGVPGPWEPVVSSREVQTGMLRGEAVGLRGFVDFFLTGRLMRHVDLNPFYLQKHTRVYLVCITLFRICCHNF